jgi:hypothetical protein
MLMITNFHLLFYESVGHPRKLKRNGGIDKKRCCGLIIKLQTCKLTKVLVDLCSYSFCNSRDPPPRSPH